MSWQFRIWYLICLKMTMPNPIQWWWLRCPYFVHKTMKLVQMIYIQTNQWNQILKFQTCVLDDLYKAKVSDCSLCFSLSGKHRHVFVWINLLCVDLHHVLAGLQCVIQSHRAFRRKPAGAEAILAIYCKQIKCFLPSGRQYQHFWTTR